jgi:hypothetical protein
MAVLALATPPLAALAFPFPPPPPPLPPPPLRGCFGGRCDGAIALPTPAPPELGSDEFNSTL